MAEVIPVELVPSEVELPPSPPASPPTPPETLDVPAADDFAADIEQAIGLKWAGWIGAIVLVIGVGLGINYAYEQGWFGHIPVPVRLALMSLGGFALIGAGEIVYRRINQLSATGPFGAGIAVLFIVNYAGVLYYEAYTDVTAYVLAVLTLLIASGVAIRGRMVSVAVLAQLGGHLGPILLSTGQPPGVPLLCYILVLQLVAVSLAAWGATPKWWALRGMSLAATAWWVLIAITHGNWTPGLGHEVLWFAALYAVIYQGELWFAAGRSRPDAEASATVAGWGTIFSLAVTAGLTAVALHVFYEFERLEGVDTALNRGGATLVLAALCLAAGLLPPPTDQPRLRALMGGYQVQAVALVILFVPVTFTDVWISLSWGILSLALAALGARFSRGLARMAALVTWLLAVIRVLVDAKAAEYGSPASDTWLTLLGEEISANSVIAWLIALLGLALAWLGLVDLVHRDGQPDESQKTLGLVTSVGASLVWAVAALLSLPPLGATLAIVLWAWILTGAETLFEGLDWALMALIILFFTAWKWFFADMLGAHRFTGWQPLEHWPLVNPQMGTAVLLAGSIAGIAWLRRTALSKSLAANWDEVFSPAGWAFALVCYTLFILVTGLSFEVDRFVEQSLAMGHDLVWPAVQVKQFGLTLLWVLTPLVLAWASRLTGCAVALAWWLLVAVTAKFLIADMLAQRLALPAGPVDVTVLFNLQVFTALAVLACTVALSRLAPLREEPDPTEVLQRLPYFLALLILLIGGTLEIDRAFTHWQGLDFRDPELAKRVAYSIYWALFAITAILLGFRFRSRELRYFGLSLFGVTLVKVLISDMNQVRFGYRVLSLLGLGLLLLATSVLYGKLRPRRLEDEDPVPGRH